MIRGLGCHLDPAGARGNWPALELFGATTSLAPSDLDCSAFLDGRILNQGGASCCVGCGLARAIQLRLRGAGISDAELPSALAIYLMARHQQGIGPEVDQGTNITAAVEAVIAHGYCPDSVWPFDPAEVTSGMPWHALQAEYDQIGLKAHRLEAEGDERCELIRLARAQGCGVVLGVDCDQRWLDWTGAAAWRIDGPRLGGHCIAALDFDSEALRIVNSWGQGWGDNGLGRIRWDMVASEHTRSVWIIDAARCYSV